MWAPKGELGNIGHKKKVLDDAHAAGERVCKPSIQLQGIQIGEVGKRVQASLQ